MLKGINQWCFPEGTDLDTLFSHSSKAGFDAVELNLYEPGGVGLTLESTAAEAESIKRKAESYGIQLRSLSTGLMWANSLSSEDEHARAKGRAIVEKQIELAHAMDIDTILVVPAFVKKEGDHGYDVAYRRSQAELAKLVPLAERNRVNIAIENVWNKFLLSPLEMARYIDELGSSWVGAYFDVGNVLNFGFPEQWIRILGPRIRKVHVKDFKLNVGNITGFVPLLAGDVDWPEVCKALREIGYADTLTAELNIYAANPYQTAYDTARHLDIILGGSAQ
ncbi:sugar phosphate isomerase/epimerase [Paenibacillus rhizovicinus]|uniref:Sugar phosphate isomerase/epimerase n=1 Tax=Paenibacillus rhizovicinus TaxID=2704463 RepID=A0A6C0P7T1_9BACL|nr:sugar phosphate isomerase/epimerase family protein [Paenibacillus rhizovicinus]QHW33693.1 sugar phosphate isomerase/epimerase [Paenibacillus rhizovicinus]